MFDPNEDSRRFRVTVDSDLEELIPGFLENRRNDIQLIKDYLELNDFENISGLGHTMKGVGGGYGFDEISEIGWEIEQAAKNHNQEAIEKQVERLQYYLDHVQIEWE